MRELFSTAIAVILLIIYVGLSVYGIQQAWGGEKNITFNENMAAALSLTGGLVSALVIAELSRSNPGEMMATRFVAKTFAAQNKNTVQVVTVLYLTAWLLCGVAAFSVYLLPIPNDPDLKLQPIADFGQTWLGIAVGAGYAYFGVEAQ